MADWTPAQIEDLTRLWATGRPAAEIAKVMNLSKNAIVGKAHRLGLPGRPSPIRRNGQARPAAPRPAPTSAAGKTKMTSSVWAKNPNPSKPKPLPVSKAPVLGTGTAGVGAKYGCCQWIIGDPKGSETLYCGEATGGATYCPGHRAVAYMKPVAKERVA